MRNNEKLHIMKHVRCREPDRTGEESFMKYDLEHYGQYLTECEKSKNTIEKYLRDVRTFLIFSGERELSKEIVLDYKKLLVEKYRTSSVNSMLIAVNGYLNWIGRDDLRVRVCRTQRTDARRVPETSYDRETGESRAPVLHPSDHRGNGDADRRIKISDSGDSGGAKDTDRL